jgi:hypothetical protein
VFSKIPLFSLDIKNKKAPGPQIQGLNNDETFNK